MRNAWLRRIHDRRLFLLFAVQPLLDALAYFCRNEAATPAGWIRLALLLTLPLWP